jgi:hypothetical protein
LCLGHRTSLDRDQDNAPWSLRIVRMDVTLNVTPNITPNVIPGIRSPT